ncbi:SET and MYND domain-containing protein 4 [Esox lucius]|uniref:Protein-lysine N-methyltransferase SMYD4 n=1 Tax=Esox lucius TaxID=8010 RepID=A0AAY5L3G0_ESOLU|nr:SET and MYND domain-containing protein 4 [Esox lucius]
MDLPCFEWQQHVKQKWNRLTPDQNKHFVSLLDIDEVFDFGLSQVSKEDTDFLSSISKRYPVQKDLEQATRCKEKGNANFKARDYTAAALLYSQGVCHASQSSEQLSLCYANRSAALFHLQLYKECLCDIDRALKHGYPSHLQHKLQGRRTQCLNHLPDRLEGLNQPKQGAGVKVEGVSSGNREAKLPDSHQHRYGSAPVSCLSPHVSVCFSPGKGRHLVANEGIAAGEAIVEDCAYSCVLIPGMEGGGSFGTEERLCHLCLGGTLGSLPCEGCSYARYCSEGCRHAAWESHHRLECPVGAELRAAGVMSQLALRMCLKAGLKEVLKAREPTRDEDRVHKPVGGKVRPGNAGSKADAENVAPEEDSGAPSARYHGDSYLSIYHLLPHLSGHTPSMRYLWSITVATLCLRLCQVGPPPTSWERGGACDNKRFQGQAGEEESGVWIQKLSLLGSVVLRHLLQLQCNAQAVSLLRDTGELTAVQTSQEVRIATAVFPTLSILNHSCYPNTSLIFRTAQPGSPKPRLDSGSALITEPRLDSGSGLITEPRLDPGSALITDPRLDSGSALTCSMCPAWVSVTVRASRDIAPGQEVLHCYGPHSSRMGLCERRRLLQEQYHFLCVCQACCLEQGEGPGGGGGVATTVAHLLCGRCQGPVKPGSEGWCVCKRSSCAHRASRSELDQKLREVKVQLEQAVDLLETEKPDQSVRMLQRATSEADLFLTETHPLQGQLADATSRAYATMGDWRAAATQLERSVVAICSQYGEDSIELGRQLFKLAQLHFNGGSPGPSLSVIPRARRLLSLHCGPHCPEVQELQAMEDCLQGAL